MMEYHKKVSQNALSTFLPRRGTDLTCKAICITVIALNPGVLILLVRVVLGRTVDGVDDSRFERLRLIDGKLTSRR